MAICVTSVINLNKLLLFGLRRSEKGAISSVYFFRALIKLMIGFCMLNEEKNFSMAEWTIIARHTCQIVIFPVV